MVRTTRLGVGPLALALLAFAASACSTRGDDPPPEPGVRVDVRDVGLDENQLPVVVLAERGGTRWLPIWIGSAEAHSIALQIEERESPRPNTHDLARRVIHGLDGEVERVVVTDLRGGTYFAELTLRASGKRVVIDSRPSDAIAIALRTGAPIFVREHLFEAAGRVPVEERGEGPSI